MALDKKLPSEIVRHIMEFAYGDPTLNKTRMIHEFKTRQLHIDLRWNVDIVYEEEDMGYEYDYTDMFEAWSNMEDEERIYNYREQYLKRLYLHSQPKYNPII